MTKSKYIDELTKCLKKDEVYVVEKYDELRQSEGTSVKTHSLLWHSLCLSRNCVAAIGVVRFSVRGFGCALFCYVEEKIMASIIRDSFDEVYYPENIIEFINANTDEKMIDHILRANKIIWIPRP